MVVAAVAKNATVTTNAVFSNAQKSIEAARKTTAHTLLWIFLALLIGAFCASFSATIGGRQRDSVVTV